MHRRLLVASLLFVTVACSRDTESRSRGATPVILISVDTLRSDRLPAYGYKGVQTPNLDAFRRDAILYERAWSHCPLTVPSHATVFTGQLPAETGLRDNTGYELAANAPTLAELFTRNGYATGAATSAYVLRKGNGLERGFSFYDGDVGATRGGVSIGAIQRDGAETIAAAQQWLASNRTRPVFFFLHLYEPHAPYDPPEPYRSTYKHPYDGEIARTDELIGRFLGFLKESGLYDDALIVFFSDHGEGLNDHGEEEHGIFLYREALQVPLLVKLPGAKHAGRSVAAPVQLSDIFPTVLAEAGIRHETRSASNARSLLDVLDDDAPPRKIYSETYFPRFHFGWSDLHSLVDGNHHFIHAPQQELYDLAADYAETNNVLTERRRVVAAMRESIAPLIREAAAPKPIAPEEAAKLAALGYIGSAADTSGPLPDPKTKTATFRQIREAFKLFRAGKFEEALAVYQPLLRENPRMLDLWEISARALARLGRTDEAIAAAQEALKLSPQATHVALLIANLSLERGRLDDAARHAELAVNAHGAEAHEILARVALAKGDTAAAERESQLALKAEGESVHAAMILARIEKEKGNYGAALAPLDRAAPALRQKQTAVPGFHFLRGDLLARLQRTREAEAALLEEIRLFPEEPQAYKNLILLYVTEDRIEDAMRVIYRLEQASPTPPSYVAISETLRVIGDDRGARFWATRGLRRFPRDRELRRLAG